MSNQGAPKGNLRLQKAHWLSRDTLAVAVPNPSKLKFALHAAAEGGLSLTSKGVQGGSEIPLAVMSGGMSKANAERFPHVSGFTALKLDAGAIGKVPELLKGQLALSARDEAGALVDATGVQIAGVLDEVFAKEAVKQPLGVSFDKAANRFVARLWAPTAKRVFLSHLDTSAQNVEPTIVPMNYDAASGVWQAEFAAGFKDDYYLYTLEVFVPATGKVERNIVADPYSLSLSTNSQRSQMVDLNDAALKPSGWDGLKKPKQDAPEDAVLYELHVRDFSIFDETVRPDYRGKYMAFTELNSNGMRHLKLLAEAGLTHVHLLPTADCASINEDTKARQEPDANGLAKFGPDSDQQQALIEPLRDKDAFNWCYDPSGHFTVPEGSYATNPDGGTRIKEFREMVKALNSIGLRVVMDVVYNHTNQSGQSEKSVLDKIVPGYYHRLNAEGQVEKSTCCENTASEHAMMEKLMIDSIVTWAREYKVDGFRFDLMGHHMLSNMQKIRAALDALTLAKDGVDGPQVLLYGEGWNFGEVANNARGKNAVQLNMAGTGIGTFNDRLRDAVRGGGPFGDARAQGFATGKFFTPNELEKAKLPGQLKQALQQYNEWIRAGLTGSLKDYLHTNERGAQRPGELILYNNQPAGYTADPQEAINYVSAHDNETLFDKITFAAPLTATMSERVRMNTLALSVVMLGQGIPFFHAGDELLRSKSLDRNSYNSGDWFNRLDFTYSTNNFGVGLPPKGDNAGKWAMMGPLLADPKLKPSKADIVSARDAFVALLKIRKSSLLFRLRTADEVKAKLRFWAAPDGVIVMQLKDASENLLVIFNATPGELRWMNNDLAMGKWALHPVLASAGDAVTKQAKSAEQFVVPGMTTAVFVGK